MDFVKHCDYIHYNPVRHQLCQLPTDWQFSSLHRLIAEGVYPSSWGSNGVEIALDGEQYYV
jgi:putative transposase